jgi:DNA-binding transcriptional LysR family regulator
VSADSLAVRPRQLAGLVAVAEHGHLDRAADELQLTPRALTRSLRELERETGEALLAGDERQVRLTPSGRRIARSARNVLDALHHFELLARADSTTLRVAHVANAGTLSTILDRVVAVHPALRADEQVMLDARQIKAVAGHRLDVAVCTAAGPLPRGLAARVLRRDPLLAVGEGAGAPLFAAYGAAWPAFDACVDAYARELGRGLERAPVPIGCGRELAALMRHAGARPVVVAASTLDATALSGAELAPHRPALTWRIVWREDDPSPIVRAFVADAADLAASLGWLER